MKKSFFNLTNNQLDLIKNRFKTPIYILSEKALLQRYNDLQKNLKKIYKKSYIAYSFKTNPTIGLIKILMKQGAYSEVVSEFEYKMALKLEVDPKRIIFNGPIKGNEILKKALINKSMVNADNIAEVKRIDAIAKSLKKVVKIGIRLTEKSDAPIWDRFGFSLNDSSAIDAIEYINKSLNLELVGLHSHIGTNIRDLSRFEDLGDTLAKFVELLIQKYSIKLKWIDFGGGLAGKNPRWEEDVEEHNLPCAKEYSQGILPPIVKVLQSNNIKAKIFFEPGRTLVESSTSILSSVVGIRENKQKKPAYILDVGLNAITTANTYRHPILSFKKEKQKYSSSLFGPLCMQKDILAKDINLPKLNESDLILIKNVGAYNISRSVPFIHPRPGILLLTKKDKLKLIKKHETLDSYLELEDI